MRNIGVFLLALALAFPANAATLLGTGASQTNPHIQGDATTGFYTPPGASEIDAAVAGNKVASWIATGSTNSSFPSPPCDILVSGCASAYSVVQRMTKSYTGALFSVTRASDLATSTFTTAPASNIVNINAIHNFCDGQDCYINEIYDQTSINHLTPGDPAYVTKPITCGTNGNNCPLLEWASNGLPFADLYVTHTLWPNVQSGTYTNTGGYLSSAATSNLPTTGSRTLYMAADNFQWSDCCDNFGYSDGPNGFTFFTTQHNPNDPSVGIFGINGEGYDYNYGAYPGGYAQFIGLIKYNSSTNQALTQILTSTCIPNSNGLCSAYTTSNGAPTFATDVSDGGNSIYVRLNHGTDTSTPGGHFQSGMIVAYATSPVEDTAVEQSLSATHFMTRPSSCMTASSTLTPTLPNTSSSNTPSTYYGTATPNLSNLVAMWGSSLLNPYYTGPLFRVQRADNGNQYDIYANGCDADAGAISTDCSGTTCTVPTVFDQSGHGWQMFQPYTFLQPALSASGMNSRACFSFTPVTNITATGQITSSNTLSVTSPTGTVLVGQLVTGAGIPNQTIILSQTSGTPGGTGVYQVSSATGTTSSETVTFRMSPYMITDTVWPNYSGSGNNGGIRGLSKNMTIEAAWQTTGTVTQYGIMLAQNAGISGWWLGNYNTSLYLNYMRNGVGSYLDAPSAWSANQAHFGYLTADGSSTQNLAMAVDNGTIYTATDTDQTPLGAGYYYVMGASGVDGNNWNGCISELAVYNDVESSANLLAAYQTAHNKWATP